MNEEEEDKDVDFSGFTALHYAVILNDQSIIKILLENGMDQDQPLSCHTHTAHHYTLHMCADFPDPLYNATSHTIIVIS